MPELPEVQTTVNGLNAVLPRHKITDVWSDYFVNTKHTRTDNIKNKKFFEKFKKEIIGEKFLKAERRGKNILIHLSGGHSTSLTAGKTILIHMKMTGHLLYGTYSKQFKISNLKFKIKEGRKEEKKKTNNTDYTWVSTDKKLNDSFNRFIHFIINFDNGKSLAFSDMRKFAKVTLFETENLQSHPDIKILGPEAYSPDTQPNVPVLDWKKLKQQLSRFPKGKIKTVLMDQTVVAGIGNIYSDEILWTAGIHPERAVEKITDKDIKNILRAAAKILSQSIGVGGDSMSDYRNIYGERGGFQNLHKVYRRAKQKCLKKGCSGVIERKVIGGRSAHFCPTHQI